MPSISDIRIQSGTGKRTSVSQTNVQGLLSTQDIIEQAQSPTTASGTSVSIPWLTRLPAVDTSKITMDELLYLVQNNTDVQITLAQIMQAIFTNATCPKADPFLARTIWNNKGVLQLSDGCAYNNLDWGTLVGFQMVSVSPLQYAAASFIAPPNYFITSVEVSLLSEGNSGTGAIGLFIANDVSGLPDVNKTNAIAVSPTYSEAEVNALPSNPDTGSIVLTWALNSPLSISNTIHWLVMYDASTAGNTNLGWWQNSDASGEYVSNGQYMVGTTGPTVSNSGGAMVMKINGYATS